MTETPDKTGSQTIATFRRYLPRFIPGSTKERKPIVAAVRLSGVIGKGGRFQPGLSLASVADTLKKAFETKSSPAVALIIDSPGGSPVQSHLIHRRIRDLAEENDKKVFAFVEDVAASGGYMIACAADEIIVDPSSIVGSIGVVSAGFGFVEAMNKIGVERRVYTAGDSKSVLDPFKPENPKDVERLRALQDEVHDMFIDLVKGRRGELLSDDPEIFSGLFWSGKSAISLGLADRIGELRSLMRETYGDKVEIKLLSNERGFIGRRLFGGKLVADAASGISETVFAELDERTLRARYGQ